MKQLLLIIAALFISATMNAGPVGKDEAQQKAAQFMTAKTGIQQSLQATQSGARRAGSTQQEPYYVFNLEGGGYVIVSGDDRTEEILGYSTTGTFDAANLPTNMRSFLQEYADAIQYIIDNDIKVDKSRRAIRRTPEMTAIEPLLKTTWNQGAPYNALCPEANGYRTFTGCVATAMAQILNYHQWPEVTTATIPAYLTDTYEIHMEGIAPETAIDWELLQANYAESYHETPEEDAVAKLMLLCGTSVQMNYGLQQDGGSSATTDDACNAFIDYFDYEEQTIRIINRNSYSYNDWQELIYNELQAERPVLYAGQSSGGGHAFVCDGYEKDDYYHINWGWGGLSDGFFKLSVLDPAIQGAGGSSSIDGYNKSQQAIIGIQKNDGVKFDMRRLTTDAFSTSANKSYTRIGKDANVTVKFHVERYNWTTEPATFKVGYRIIDSDGNTVGDDIIDTEMNNRTYAVNYGRNYDRDITFGANLEDGDYRIIPVSSVTGDMMPDVYGEENYVAFRVNGNTFTITYTQEDPALQLLSSNVAGEKEAGAPQTITLNVKNTGGAIHDDVYMNIYYKESNAPSSSKELIGYMPVSFLELEKNQTTQIEIYYTPKTAGVYTLELIDKNHKKLGPSVQFTINPSTAPLLSLEEMVLPTVQTEEGQSYVEKDELTVILKIKNEGVSTYKGKLVGRYRCLNPESGSWYSINGTDITKDITIEPGEILEQEVTMQNWAPYVNVNITLQRIEFTYTQYGTQEVDLGETPNIEYRTAKLDVTQEVVENAGDETNTFTGNEFALNFDITNSGLGSFNKRIGASIFKYYDNAWHRSGYVDVVKQVNIEPEATQTVQFKFDITKDNNVEKYQMIIYFEADDRFYTLHQSSEYTHAEDSGIEEVMYSGSGKPNKVYNLQGRQVGVSTDFGSLKPGIYVVGGKKLMKR